MRIVLSGSGGAILHLDRFLEDRAVKLDRPAFERKQKQNHVKLIANIEAMSTFV